MTIKTFPVWDDFRRKLEQYACDNPQSRWHLGYSNQRIYLTIKELSRYFRPGCTIVDMGCLPPNIPIGMKIADMWEHCNYLGICSEEPGNEIYRYGQDFGIKLEAINLDPKFDMFDYVSSLPQKCSLPDNSVDIIIATEILEHLAWPHSLLQEAYRLLKPDGIIIASTPNATNAGVLLKCIIGRGAFENYNDSHLTSKHWMKHLRFYSYNDIDQLFSDNGLQLIEKKYLSDNGLYASEKGLKAITKKTFRSLMHIVPWWREGLFFVAQKNNQKKGRL